MASDLQNDRYSGFPCKEDQLDLFATEAHFHQPVKKKFYSKHQTEKGFHRSSR